MKRNLVGAVLVGLAWMAIATPLHAESGVPEPGVFFANTPEFDPKAKGEVLPGFLTVAYVFSATRPADVPPEVACDGGLWVANMFTVLTLEYGKNVQPFNTDFRPLGPPFNRPATPSMCFDNQTAQVNFALNLIRRAVGTFYQCDIATPGDCPAFKVKSVANMNSTGEGALSLDIEVAVERK